MSPATACGRTLVDELVRCGVRDAVLSPGSRSAPLALALHAADTAGRLRLHVRIDERTAGFLALGLAKGSGRPVPVVTTSGTAVVNLHPALLEASHAGVAVLAVTADRPASLRATGANQTTDQVKVFGTTVRVFEQIAAAAGSPPAVGSWRAAVCRVVAAACGVRTAQPGPVHLNVAFEEPLVPEAAAVDEPLGGRPGGAPWTRIEPATPPSPVRLEAGPRTVVVAGDQAGPAARHLAESAGWPLLAEPSSGARAGANALRAYRLLLDHERLAGRIQRAVVYGHSTLSRVVTGLLSRPEVEVLAVAPQGPWTDVGHQVSQVVGAATVDAAPADDRWLREWLRSDARASAAVDAVLAREPGLTSYTVAEQVWEAVPSGGLLVIGSSNPIRDVDLMAEPYDPGGRREVLANRGLSGIDGTVSTAVGAALGRISSRAYALLGDLTFLHDSTGLLLGPAEPRPDLTMVVVNDDGGGIFGLLEQGDPAQASAFERVFGTPTGTDLGALCAATATPHLRVRDPNALTKELEQPANGIRVVEAVVDRAHRRDLEARLREAAMAALG